MTRENALDTSIDGLDDDLIGHNVSPDSFGGRINRARALLKKADEWTQTEVDDEATAGVLETLIEQIKAHRDLMDDERKAARRPHDDAVKAVQEKYRPHLTALDTAYKAMKAKGKAWLDKLAARKAEAERKAREEAEKQAREAEEARQAAEASGSVTDTVAAEEAARKASEAQEAAEAAAATPVQMRSQYGSRARSVRKVWTAKVVDLEKALAHYGGCPEIKAAVLSLAKADAREAKDAKVAPAGVEFYQEEIL